MSLVVLSRILRGWLGGCRSAFASLVLCVGFCAIVALALNVQGPRVGLGPDARAVLEELAVARVAAGLLVGAALAVAGVLAQGLFRNSLADPSVLGTSAGASLGGKVALLAAHGGLGAGRLVAADGTLGWLPVGCLVGALGALVVLLLASRQSEGRVVLLLTGFLLSSLFMSTGALLTSWVQDRWELSRAVLQFALGDLSGSGRRQLAVAAPLVGLGVVGALGWGGALDVLLSGEEEAQTLGVDRQRVRRWTTAWIALLTAGAVALGGNVGFVGLVVPHALRSWFGETHRRLVVNAALAGGGFVVLCDVLARALPTRAELPLGVITGLVGAPVLLTLLYRGQRSRGWFED